MAYDKPALSILCVASAAVRGVRTVDNALGDGARDAKISVVKEGVSYDNHATSSTTAAYEADE